MVKPGRNELCPCGSGKKYKKCCALADSAEAAGTPAPETAPLLALLNAGRHAELESAARSLLKLHENDGMLWKLLGAALWAQGRDAVPALQCAARLSPEDAESHTNLGNVLRAAGRPEEAAASHRRALQVRPDYAEAHANLGSALRDLGRLDEAIACYLKALAHKPDFALAHNNLGITLQQLGRPEEAIASHRRAIVMKPGFAQAHFAMGRALRALGRRQESADSYRRGIEIIPTDADALLALGNVLLEGGHPDEASEAYRRALALRPDLAEAHSNLGNALRDLGEIEEAAESYRKALALKPEVAETHSNLGNALLDLGQIEGAVESYRRALELRPDFAKAHSNLGAALRELGDLDEARESLLRAVAIQPDLAEVHSNLAVVYRLLGRQTQAEASCQRALELKPESVTAIATLAELRSDRGEFAEAEALYLKAKSIEPDSPLAWAGIPGLRRMSAADQGWIDEARRIAQLHLRPRDESNLRYAMGKYCDDLKDYAGAFENYRRANEISRSYAARHDRGELERTFDFIINLYSSDWVRHRADDGNPSTRPIFVVGMPRSGTTLAEQILAAHPDAFGAGEQAYWKAASPRMAAAMLEQAPMGPIVREFADGYVRMIEDLSAGAGRIVDKMPANFAHLGMIHAALPNARIIHMRRNPIDTCLSIYFHNFHVMHSYANDLDDLAHYYGQYRRVMEHWRAILPPGAIFEVDYEDLVADPQTWTRRMVEFAGLPWDVACLDFHRNATNVSTFSKWQVRQKISSSSVERWRNYEPYVGPLLPLTSIAAVA